MAKVTRNREERNKREAYFKIVSLLFSVLLIFLFEGALRLFHYGNSMRLVVNHSHEAYKDFHMINPHVGEKYFSRLEATSTNNDIFLKQKPENGFRIFVMGSSTVYGYPYDNNLMASRILHQRLEDAYPDRQIEVVNTALTAINSITLKDFTGQILKYEPDAILIYAGHNEYYGAFGIGSNETMSKSAFLRSLNFTIMNLRIAQLVKSGIGGISKQLNKNPEGNDPRGTLMKRIVKDKDIIYGSKEYRIGIDQFRDNLGYILEKAAKKEVPVFLSDLVSNVRDLPPFGDPEGTGMAAHSAYREAINLLEGGDTLGAKAAFYRAKDLDPVRFRASEEINHLIDSLAKNAGVIFIPSKKWFSEASEGGLIGNALLSEHVHPNIKGQFILADAFYTAIVESGLMESGPNPYTVHTKEYYRRNWGYTALDSLVGAFKIEQLKSHWPFTSLDGEYTFRDTFKTSGLIDSLAFTVLLDPKANLLSLHDFLGGYYEANQQVKLACREYMAMVRINPYNSSSYNKAVNCLLKLNDLHAAEIYLEKSLEFAGSFYAYTMLAEIESIKHNYPGVVEAYTSALRFVDKDMAREGENVRNELEKARQRAGNRNPTAAFEYPMYVPSDILPLYNMGLLQMDSDPDSSLYYFSRCLEINDCPLVNWRMGNILMQKQDKKVLFYYTKAYAGFSKDPQFLVNLIVANLVNDRKGDARLILNELVAIDPGNSSIARLQAALR
ncbi:MAG: hypothetical protein R6W31_10900 [Bacteroidales bacterium]